MNIFVFGNLGSGKGTLINGLNNALPNISIVEEKFDKNPFLNVSNDNPKRWGLSLQLNFLLDYIDSYREAIVVNNKEIVVIDAGVWTNWYVFTDDLKNKGLISEEEYKLYVQLVKTLIGLVHYPEPDIILYLNTSPEKCLERIKIRRWKFQKGTNISYLNDLDQELQKMISDYRTKKVKIIEVNNEEADIRNQNEIKTIVSMIEGIKE